MNPPKLPPSSSCCGCGSCSANCPHSAISMQTGDDGFSHPSIDPGKCRSCGRCETVCPILRTSGKRVPIAAFAAQADGPIRAESSSGGLFTVLAQYAIGQGGVVWGARMADDNSYVFHSCAETEQDLEPLRKSKYVQSRTAGVWSELKRQTDSGRFVLFTGTPCQIAAARLATNHPDNLLLVEIACHGVPSETAWRAYVHETEKIHRGKIVKSVFRDKIDGWSTRLHLTHVFENKTRIRTPSCTDPFYRAFLSNLSLRDSCHHCRFREGRSGADMTLADYWGIEGIHPDMDDQLGTSLVLLQTEKGQNVFYVISSNLSVKETSFVRAVQQNPILISDPKPHTNRTLFLQGQTDHLPFATNVRRCLDGNFPHRILKSCKRFIRNHFLR